MPQRKDFFNGRICGGPSGKDVLLLQAPACFWGMGHKRRGQTTETN